MTRPLAVGVFAVVVAGTTGACSSPPSAAPGTQVMMDFTRAGGFYAAPFPDESRRRADGTIDLSGFPNPVSNSSAAQLLVLAAGAPGFGLTSAIYFRLTDPIDARTLPDVHASIRADSPVFLVGVDEKAPDFRTRYPVIVGFRTDAGPFGASNLLALLPLQGVPLRPHTRYAAVVLRSLLDGKGAPLGVSPGMAQLAAGTMPPGMGADAFAAYQSALAALDGAHVARATIAGLAVFTTWDPTAGFAAVVKDALSRPPPMPVAPFALTDTFPDFCVYQTTIDMPDYQRGKPPFLLSGGDWAFAADGTPMVQRQERANFIVTVPRKRMPAAGFPMVLFERAGGGGERPLIERGRSAGSQFDGPIVPGTGPAHELATVSFAGASVDGPLEGLRNTTNGNEDFLLFNILNLLAMRDNMRQSSLELVVQAHVIDSIQVDASGCPGVATPTGGPVKFDATRMALMGHSLGATITPLAMAFEPRFGALIVSGAGGSWIENVVYKLKPVKVLVLAEAVIGLTSDYHLNQHDPLLTLLQWAGEPADPPVYAPRIVSGAGGAPPRHVLMFQGIVDHYILPPIANATSLSIGLDLAGDELDGASAELKRFAPLGGLLDLVGRRAITLPASGNRTTADGSQVTAVVVQHLGDGIEDGHEIMFQTDAPKREYRCFLEGFAAGRPRVPAPGAADAPCQ